MVVRYGLSVLKNMISEGTLNRERGTGKPMLKSVGLEQGRFVFRATPLKTILFFMTGL